MDRQYIVLLAVLVYLLVLFGLAYYTEYRLTKGRSIIRHPVIYALSLAIYCTAWTYYGSVGRASTHGLEFLAIYLGPTFACILFIPFMKKLIRIARHQRTNTIADFISNRYGKDYILGYVVAIFCIIGIIPYISLQIKAIGQSIEMISGIQTHEHIFYFDNSFYLCILLIVFIILFGTRSVDASEKHEGMVAAVSFESIVKLIAFLAGGLFIIYAIYNGFNDVFSKATEAQDLHRLFLLNEKTSYTSWLALLMISTFAFIFLPRQFQIAVVENVDENHLNKASWILPLYLFIINLFVLPIALAGLMTLGNHVNPDTFVLALPLHENNFPIGLLVFIGGFSAATGMIIVETIALCIMTSNNIIMPVVLRWKSMKDKENNLNRLILNIRRASIIVIIMLAYWFDKYVAHQLSLVSIGLISFAAVSQFAPAVILGLYWKDATRNGALWGIVTGFIIWAYTLVIPTLIDVDFFDFGFMKSFYYDFPILDPHTLFGLDNLDILTVSVFWSLLCNTLVFILVSLLSKRNVQEIYQAEIFVNIFQYEHLDEAQNIWKNNAYLSDVKNLLENFIDKQKVNKLIQNYANRHKIDLNKKIVDARVISFAENVLSGIVGSASARNLVSTFAKEKEISNDEALKILAEADHVIDSNKELRKKSIELERTKISLEKLNAKLKDIDSMKDEFLYTVTHEIRTPLTSVKAMAELIQDNPDMDESQKDKFLHSIIKETDRLSYLITQVLTLEKFDSGGYKLNISTVEFSAILMEAVETLSPMAQERKVKIETYIPNTQFIISCDKNLLSQAILNLISNAIKFSKQGAGEVSLRVMTMDNDLMLCVEDNGPGIEEEMKDLIFDKFFQAKNQTLRKPEGTGLGLAICKKIIDLHHGKIWVESMPGLGAKFYFTIPMIPSYE